MIRPLSPHQGTAASVCPTTPCRILLLFSNHIRSHPRRAKPRSCRAPPLPRITPHLHRRPPRMAPLPKLTTRCQRESFIVVHPCLRCDKSYPKVPHLRLRDKRSAEVKGGSPRVSPTVGCCRVVNSHHTRCPLRCCAARLRCVSCTRHRLFIISTTWAGKRSPGRAPRRVKDKTNQGKKREG